MQLGSVKREQAVSLFVVTLYAALSLYLRERNTQNIQATPFVDQHRLDAG